LTGFIEADGNFYCGFDLNSKGIAVVVKNYMRISQKQLYKATSDWSKENNSLILAKLASRLAKHGLERVSWYKKCNWN
jgi:hypothetical protein